MGFGGAGFRGWRVGFGFGFFPSYNNSLSSFCCTISGVKKKSLLTLYRYDFLCFLLNINSLAHIKMEVSATLTCYSLAAVRRHHGSHLSSDNESMKSFRKIMHYMVHESSVPLHRDTDDASSKKT